MAVFEDVKPCRLAYRSSILEERAASRKETATLKVEAVDFSETLVPVCQDTRHHIQKSVILILAVMKTSDLMKSSHLF